MKVTHIDHLVLTVADVDASCRFYTSVLGMEEISFGQGRRAVAFGNQKINFHQRGHELQPRALHPKSGSGDLCFITDDSISDAIGQIQSCEIEIIEGPVARTGAKGPMTSIYIRDPDQNLIEISTYQM